MFSFEKTIELPCAMCQPTAYRSGAKQNDQQHDSNHNYSCPTGPALRVPHAPVLHILRTSTPKLIVNRALAIRLPSSAISFVAIWESSPDFGAGLGPRLAAVGSGSGGRNWIGCPAQDVKFLDGVLVYSSTAEAFEVNPGDFEG